MPDYDSPFFITNDRADIDQVKIENGTAVVWQLSADAKMVRSPERQYCGNYVTYGDKGAATYRHNDDTHALIAAGPHQHRDMVSSFPLVKTLAKAQARGDRQLLDVQEQDIRVTTTLADIPAERVTLAKAGMRLQVKGTHWGPTLDTWHYGRIVSAQPTPHSDGSLFDIDLEIVVGTPVELFVSDGPPPPDVGGTAFAGLQRTDHYIGIGYLPAYQGSYNSGEEVSGYPTYNETGGLTVVESSAPFRSILCSVPMIVRIEAVGQGADVFVTPETRTLSVTVNGVVVGTDSSATGTGFQAWQRTVDLRDFHLDAGDVVSVTGTATDDWGSVGTTTYMRVGRGTLDITGDPGDPWVGP